MYKCFQKWQLYVLQLRSSENIEVTYLTCLHGKIREDEGKIGMRQNLKRNFFIWRNSPPPQWARASSFMTFLDHTRHTTVGRTPLYEWSARRRDLYLTANNTQDRQTSMPPVGIEPTVSAGERPQTCALERAVTGTGWSVNTRSK